MGKKRSKKAELKNVQKITIECLFRQTFLVIADPIGFHQLPAELVYGHLFSAFVFVHSPCFLFYLFLILFILFYCSKPPNGIGYRVYLYICRHIYVYVCMYTESRELCTSGEFQRRPNIDYYGPTANSRPLEFTF